MSEAESKVKTLVPSLFFKFNFKTLLIALCSEKLAVFWLLLVFCGDWMNRDFNLLHGPSIRGEIILGSILAYILFKLFGQDWIILLLPLLLLLVCSSFIAESSGRLIFSDDHPVFLYRLDLIKNNFPKLTFYDTRWNAGIDSLHLFASGAYCFFFLNLLLVYFVDLLAAYNFSAIAVLFGFVPLASFYAARVEGLDRKFSAIAAVLAVSCSLFWYRWALKYGTMGFVVCSAILPYFLSMFAKILDPSKKITNIEISFFTVGTILMLGWSPLAILVCPLSILCLFQARRLLLDRRLVISAAVILVVSLSWMILFWRGWNVANFIDTNRLSYSTLADNQDQQVLINTQEEKISLKKAFKILRENIFAANPLVILLFLPGLVLLKSQSRKIYLLLSFWLFFLSIFVGQLKPQLELDRLLIVFCLLSAIPSAHALRQLTDNARQYLIAAFVFGFLIASIYSTAAVIANRSSEKYFFAEAGVYDLADAIEQHAGEGRVFFAGFVLHDLSQGHLAPLTTLTSKSMIASSHVHNRWNRVDALPKDIVEGGEESISGYFDLYNVSLVASHEAAWQNYFDRHPENYQAVWRNEKFVLYRRIHFKSNYFIEGSGKITLAGKTGIKLYLADKSAAIKFNYYPALEVHGCSKIEPRAVSEQINFISLSGCQVNQPITINTKSFLQRLYQGV